MLDGVKMEDNVGLKLSRLCVMLFVVKCIGNTNAFAKKSYK